MKNIRKILMKVVLCCAPVVIKKAASAFIVTPVRGGSTSKSFSSFSCGRIRKVQVFSTISRTSTTFIHQTLNGNNEIIDDISGQIILSELNDSQRAAVTSPAIGITRVVAGPGAGKTRVLTSRIAWLLFQQNQNNEDNQQQQRRYNNILAVTFTKKAAGEMKSRLQGIMNQCCGEEEEEMIRQKLNRVTLGTFHSVCARILRAHADELSELQPIKFSNFDSTFAIVDQSGQIAVLKKCLNDLKIDVSNESIKPKQILDVISKMKSLSDEENRQLQKEQQSKKNGYSSQAKKNDRILIIAKEIFASYQSTLLENNSIDFDDLILYTRDLLLYNAGVRDTLRQRWAHILVDEFQDTSRVQLELIQHLTTSSLLVVGDSDQSIYSWRGADVNSMNNFANQFTSSEQLQQAPQQIAVETVYLMENYRSTTNIVKAAQKVISVNKASDRSRMIPMRGDGPKPRVLACRDSKTEAEFVVRTILNDFSITPPPTIAIIYRTNRQSRAIEEECAAQKLKYVVRGTAGKFYSRPEIKDCLCFLQCLYNGRDKASFIRATKTPTRGIGEVAINEFFEYYDKVLIPYKVAVSSSSAAAKVPTILQVLLSLLDTTTGGNNNNNNKQQEVSSSIPYFHSPHETISKRATSKFIPFAQDMKIISELAKTETTSDLLNSIITRFKLREHFNSISNSEVDFTDRWGNVMELINAANTYNDGPSMIPIDDDDGRNNTPLGTFLDEIALLSDITDEYDKDDDDKNRVTANLMTIHSSKGMEFDTVVLIGNEEGTFPTQRAMGVGNDSVELQEERRLCYVAMTRAKTNLILTWRKEVEIFSGLTNGIHKINTNRSRFLDALVGSSSNNNNNADDGTKTTAGTTNSKLNNNKFSSSSSNGSSSSKTTSSYRSYTSSTSSNSRQPTASTRSSSTYNTQTGSTSNSRQQPTASTSSTYNTQKNSSSRSYDTAITYPRQLVPVGEIQNADSTLFYPVGAKVSQIVHGRGIVVSNKDTKNNLVSVKFDNGFCVDYPMEKNGLKLDYE